MLKWNHYFLDPAKNLPQLIHVILLQIKVPIILEETRAFSFLGRENMNCFIKWHKGEDLRGTRNRLPAVAPGDVPETTLPQGHHQGLLGFTQKRESLQKV